jgi:hypothetical protein
MIFEFHVSLVCRLDSKKVIILFPQHVFIISYKFITATLLSQVIDADRSPSNPDRNHEITEEMMQEMDYNADRAW